MLTFGIIAEGPTDQTVIENILLGYFETDDEDPIVRYIQPPRPLSEKPAGWTQVFKSLERGDHVGALQFNDYLVIHIDTDVQEEPGFDVPRRHKGKALSVSGRVEGVVARLKRHIDPAFSQANGHRIVFAVAVESIECWILPLLYSNQKASKTTGCLESANQILRKANQDALSSGEKKFIRAYDKVSSRYRKVKTLAGLRDRNPSLQLFIEQLDTLKNQLSR